MPKLVIHSGTSQAREFELKPGSNYLGRGDTNDFIILDPSVSTNHAQIIVNGGTVTIKDMDSTNGTFINHARTTEGILQPGQPLRLGGVEVVYVAEAAILVEKPVEAATTSPAATAPRSGQIRIPSPKPSPSAGGLKIAGLHTASTVAIPPEVEQSSPESVASTSAPAKDLVDPPAGKTACKFHSKNAGEWLCQKCNELFCSVCVSTKKTSAGVEFLCRKCGTACAPVRVKFVAPKEKKAHTKYSDGAILARSLGFGLGAALLSALIWTGLSWLFGFDIPFIFCSMSAALCGYAVKIACQDTPGVVFSVIAVAFTILGSTLGKLGMIVVTHLTLNTNTTLLTSAIGLAISIYLAWKIGGGEL